MRRKLGEEEKIRREGENKGRRRKLGEEEK